MRRGTNVLVALSLVGSAVPCLSTEPASTIHACAHKNSGDLRVVEEPADCRPSEVPMSWSVEGPPGPPGQPGTVPNDDVARLADLAGDPEFADGLPRGLVQPLDCLGVLEVTGLGDAPIPVVGMIGADGISRIPRYRIVVEAPPAPTWLGSPVEVRFTGDQSSATFGGIVTEVAEVGSAAGGPLAAVELAPIAARLGLDRGFQVIQGASIPDLLDDMMNRVGQPFERLLSASYEPLDMVVQYRETDLDFLNRLLEEAGVFYYFRSDGRLVATDFNDGLDRGAGSITFGDGAHGRRLTSFRSGDRLAASAATVIGFDFETTVAPVVATAPPGGGHPELAFFRPSVDSPGGAASAARIELERARAASGFATGSSTAADLRAGRVVTIDVGTGLDGSYIVTGVRHVFVRDSNGCLLYGNAFNATPDARAYRPPRVTPQPRITGPESAIVVGRDPLGVPEDEFGRVKVKFHWDRAGGDSDTSAWIRVAHPAGRTDAAPAYVPDVGDEVLVLFAHGDVRFPYVVGSLYNAVDTPPE